MLNISSEKSGCWVSYSGCFVADVLQKLHQLVDKPNDSLKNNKLNCGEKKKLLFLKWSTISLSEWTANKPDDLYVIPRTT